MLLSWFSKQNQNPISESSKCLFFDWCSLTFVLHRRGAKAWKNGGSLSWRPILFKNVKRRNWEFYLESCLVLMMVHRQLTIEMETLLSVLTFGHPGPTQNRESNHISKKPMIHSVFLFVPHIILFVRFFRIAEVLFIQKRTWEVPTGGTFLYCQSSVPDLTCTILPSLRKVQKKKKSFDFINRHKLSRKSQLTFSACLPCPKHCAAKRTHVHSHSHSGKDGVIMPSS